MKAAHRLIIPITALLLSGCDTLGDEFKQELTDQVKQDIWNTLTLRRPTAAPTSAEISPTPAPNN
jgi:hypothetical protein